MSKDAKVVFTCSGRCPTCDRESRFDAYGPWFRDFLACTRCGSIPRERALMLTIERWFPQWRQAVVHESSPSDRGASARLARECPQYVASQWFPRSPPGQRVGGVRNENLERLSFADASIDLHVTQDVFEHVLDPEAAFREIARTLRPGGMHVFTVPIVNKHRPTSVRARMEGGVLRHLAPEQYHGNPVGDGRALVTVDWGYDICEFIHRSCGLFTHMVQLDDLSHGIRAEYIEVLVTVKR